MTAQDKTKDQLLDEIASLKEALTDQQQQIEQLRQSEKKFLNLFRDSAVGMAVVMADGRFIQANQAFCNFLGYSEPELLQNTILSITHPDDREVSSQAIQQTFTSGPRIQHYEKRYLHKSGRSVWGEVTNTLISDAEGTPNYAIAQVLDINERTQVLEALVEKESRLLEAQEVARLGFYVLDPATGRWTSSSVLDSILGISGDYEKTIDGWANLIHPDERQEILDYFLKHVVGEKSPCDREYRIVRYEDKQVRWIHGLGRWRFHEDGQPIGMLGTVQDITERRKAEESLRISEAKFRRLHRSMRDAFFTVGMDGFIQEFNEVYSQMIGYEPEEIIKLRYNDITPEKWHSVETEIVETQVLTRGYSEIYEEEYRRKDGTIFPVELRTYLIRDEKGQPAAMWAIVRDITERKRAEQALQRTHDELEHRVAERTAELTKTNKELVLFRKFAEASGQGFGMGDLDCRIAYVNPALCRLFGESKPEDLIGESFLTYYPEEWKQRRKDEVIPAQEKTGHWAGEQALLSRQGKLISTLHDIFLLRDEKGEPVRRCMVVTDISERKQAEEALRQSHDELRIIYDEMADGIVIVDLENSHPIRANSAICRMLGYSEEELRAMSPVEVHPPEVMPKIQEHIDSVAQGQIARFEDIPFLRKDGSLIYADEVSSRIFYNGRFCRISFLHNVTERKLAQEALQQSEAKYRHLIETTDTGYVILDDQSRVLDANVEFVRQTGHYELNEIIGRRVGEWTAPYDAERNAQEVAKCLQNGGTRHLEIDYISSDGKITPIEINASVLDTKQGRQIIGLCRDITERKKAQDALQREHRTLKHLLQSSDHERQTIAYEIHDSLAQYLAGAIMQFQAYDHFSESKPKLARKAYDGGMTMLQQSHFEARRLIAGVRPPVLDEAGAVEAIVHLINEHNRDQRPQIEFNSKVKFGRLVPILENAIYRICQEGLSNACKHSHSEKVLVSLLQRKDQMRIEIRDWGIGFDPKNGSGSRKISIA